MSFDHIKIKSGNFSIEEYCDMRDRGYKSIDFTQAAYNCSKVKKAVARAIRSMVKEKKA